MREKIRLDSSAGTGHFYTTTKNKRTDDHGQDVIRAEDKAEVNAMVKAALGGKTKMKESVLNMFAYKLKGDSE